MYTGIYLKNWIKLTEWTHMLPKFTALYITTNVKPPFGLTCADISALDAELLKFKFELLY